MFIGIDAGSLSFKLVVLNQHGELIFSHYEYHYGNPLNALSQSINKVKISGINHYAVCCITGSGRYLIAKALKANLVKNEITALWKATTQILPEVRTVIEIGGQDSKLLSIRNTEIEDFKLNSVCAAGTGSFIEQQANRIGINIEKFSEIAAGSETPAKFSGRCTVFIETEIINLQQRGYPVEAIVSGLCRAICENFLNDLGAGIPITAPVLFCGGVSRIKPITEAFQQILGIQMMVPSISTIAAAYGAGLLAMENLPSISKSINPEYLLPEPEKIQDITSLLQCDKTDCLNCGNCGNLITRK